MASNSTRSPCWRKPRDVAASSNETPSRRNLSGVEFDKGKTLGQFGNRREDGLTLVKRKKPDRILSRIGIALDDRGALPGLAFRKPLGGPIGADEVRNLSVNGAEVETPGLEHRPDLGPQKILVGMPPRSTEPPFLIAHAENPLLP